MYPIRLSLSSLASFSVFRRPVGSFFKSPFLPRALFILFDTDATNFRSIFSGSVTFISLYAFPSSDFRYLAAVSISLASYRSRFRICSSLLTLISSSSISLRFFSRSFLAVLASFSNLLASLATSPSRSNVFLNSALPIALSFLVFTSYSCLAVSLILPWSINSFLIPSISSKDLLSI